MTSVVTNIDDTTTAYIGPHNNQGVTGTDARMKVGTNTSITDTISIANTAAGVTASVYQRGWGFDIVFEMTGAVVALVDAGASGSYGTIQLGNFNANWDQLWIGDSYIAIQDVTSETTADVTFDVGVGTTAMAAPEDGNVVGTDATAGNLVANSTTILLASNTKVDVIRIHDSVGEALDLAGTTGIHFNISGTALTSDVNEDFTFNGRIVLRVEPTLYIA